MKSGLIFLVVLLTVSSCEKNRVSFKNSSPIDVGVRVYITRAADGADLLNPETDGFYDIKITKFYFLSEADTIHNKIPSYQLSNELSDNGKYSYTIGPNSFSNAILAESIVKVVWPDESINYFKFINRAFGNGGWTTTKVYLNEKNVWDVMNENQKLTRQIVLSK